MSSDLKTKAREPMSDDTDKAAREWVGGINFSSIFTAEDMVLAFIAGATHERSRPLSEEDERDMARAIHDAERRADEGPISDEEWHEMWDWYARHRDDPNSLAAHSSRPARLAKQARAAHSALQRLRSQG